jgi:hypothetical protein
MSLTRVTTSVISSNVISSDLLQNNIIQSRHIQPGSITTDLLEASGNAAAVEIRVNANLDIVQDNVAAIVTGLDGANTNINTVQANLYTDFTTLTGLIDDVQDNVTSTQSNVTAVESRRATNTSIFTDAFTGTNAAVTAISDGATEFSVNKIFQQNVTIQGNLIVVGSQVDLGVGTATIDDNFIVVSANLTGIPATDSGIMINRGSEGNTFIGDHIAEDGVVFALSQSPHDNATIAIQEYLDVHANAFHAASAMNFNRTHFAHVDDESTGMIIDTTNSHIKFIVSGTEQANINSTGNLFLSGGIIHGPSAANNLDLDDDELGDRQNSITLRSLQSVGVFLDSNDSETGNFFNIYDGEDDPNAVTKDGGLFSVRDTGDVFVSQSINIGTTANVAGVDLVSNDYVTYTRLNANLNSTTDNINTVTDNVNIVQDNVTAITGGATLLVPFTNVNTALGTSNVFFIGQDCANDSNVLVVTLDGIRQHPTIDWIGNYSNDTVQFIDDTIPSGTIVSITSLAP